MKEIYFIRHGQTNENSLSIRQGSEIDSELNELGRKQAKKTGKYLKKYRMKYKSFDCIISSPMKRAISTAEIIRKEIRYPKKIEIFELRRGKMSGLAENDKYRQKIEKDITAIFKKNIVFSNKNIAFFKYICKNIKASTLPLNIYN
jgi:broad specificity phosphatase PhoE